MKNETVRETVERVVDEAFRMKEEDERFYAELASESDRGAAILAAEYFDERLKKAIEHKFFELDNEICARIEEENGELRRALKSRFLGTNFSTRINIGRALGLYNRETRDRLNDIRQIRNSFAHPSVSEPLDFNTKSIVEKCKTLPLKSKPEPVGSRDRYIQYLSEVGDHLWSSLMELRKRTVVK